MTGVSINTVTKLLVDLGTVCANAHDALVQNVNAKQIQVDEIWSFAGSKQKNVPAEKQGEYGDLWTWIAIDADTKLIISYVVGARVTPNAYSLIWDVAERVTNERPQITTDGLIWYAQAIEEAMPWADYGIVNKKYAAEATGRYSPAKFVAADQGGNKRRPQPTPHLHVVRGTPEPHDAHVDAQIHAADQRLQQEGAEPRACRRAKLHVLQLLPHSQDAARHSRDGGRTRASSVDD